MHERVLYFSFPFLLLFIASFIGQISYKKELAMVIVLLISGSFSLIIERQHYKLFINNRYKLVAKSIVDWQGITHDTQPMVVKFTHKKIDEYYNAKYGYTNNEIIYSDSTLDIKNFVKLLENSKHEYLYFGRAEIINPTYLQIALNYYPKIIKKAYSEAGEAYLLKKDNSITDLVWPGSYYQYHKDFRASDSAYLISNDEYIATVEALVDTLIFSKWNIIEISMQLIPLDTIGGAQIVSSMEKNGEIIDWRSIHVDDFIISDTAFNNVMFSIPIPDIRLKRHSLVKFFIWNPNRAKFKIKNFNIITRPGNPYIYGTKEPIPINLSRYCLQETNK
jgi:hypothetical protein